MRTSIRQVRSIIRGALLEYSLEKGKTTHLKSSSPDAREMEDDVFDLIDKSYAPIGGNLKVSKASDVGSEYSDWVVADIDDDPEPDVFVGGKKKRGMKAGAFATDGTPAAKSKLSAIQKDLLSLGWWTEVSGAPAHILINKLGMKPLDDEKKVRALLGDKQITWHGAHPEGKFPGTSGWYTRDIGGHAHAKIILGDA